MSASSKAPPPVPSTAGRAAQRTLPPLAGFLIDIGLAAVLMAILSILSGIIWYGYTTISQLPSGPPDLSAPPPPLIQILMALFATGGTALLLYFLRRPADAAERSASRHALARPTTWGWTALVAVAVVLGSNGLSFLGRQFGVEPVPTNLDLMNRSLQQFPWFLALFAVVLAPAYEELLFRRVLFGRLWQAGKPWLGLVLSSLAFALIHELPGTSANGPLQIALLWLVYGGMGAAFCWLYRRTGTLWAPIIAHATNNAVALASLVFFGS